MALITTAARSELIALYVAMFKAAPGAANLTDMVTAYEAGGTTATIAKTLAAKADFATVYPGFSTGTEFSASLVANLLGSNVTAAITTWAEGYVLGLLNAGKSRADAIVTAVVALRATANTEFTVAQAAMANSVDVASHYSITKAQGTATSTLATLQGVIAGVTSVAASATTAKATIDTAVTTVATAATTAATAAAAVGNTLTTSVQTLTGTAGDDTFTAPAGTWGAGDIVNGGTAGTDTLNATITGTGPTQSATSLVSIEVLNLTASPNSSTLDLTGVTGLTQVNNVSSANGATLSVSGLGNVVNTTITGGNTSTTVAYTTAAVASTTADAATLSLKGTPVGTAFTTSGVETLTINSGTSANTLTTLSAVGMTRLNITGDQALTIIGTVGNTGTTTPATTTYDAGAATGAVTLTQTGSGSGTLAAGVTVFGPTAATAGAFTVTTGGNNDTVTLGANTTTVTTGAGSDTITAGAGIHTITPGDGNDTINLNVGVGVDTVRFAEVGATHADTINNFGATDVLSLTLGRAAVTGTSAASANAAFGTLQTGGTSPVLSNVGGTGTGTAISFQVVAPGATATSGTVLATSNVIALNGAYTDGTVAGAVAALGSTAETGIATTPTGKFLLVTYSVGNIAQVWSFAGDSVVDTNITAAELSLVATLNGVAQNSLTAANFATFLTPATTAATVSNAGQTMALTGTLNTVLSASNSAGQFLTSGNDIITVGVGTLPTAATTATTGLTIIDPSSTDADVMNATVLGNWAAGSIISGIETINLEMLVLGTTFAATAITPGTKQFGLTGTQNFIATALPDAGGLTLGAGYTGTGTFGVISDAGAADSVVINLAGSTATSTAAGANIAYVQLNATSMESATVNVSAASSIRMSGTDLFAAAGDITATALAGSGSLTVFGTATALGTMNLNGSGVGYTGALTVRPSTNAAMDFSTNTAAAGLVTGISTINLQDLGTYASLITLAAANTTVASTPVTISFSPTTASGITTLGAASIAKVGGGQSDVVNLSLGANAASVAAGGTFTATTIETLNITSARASTATLTLGSITLTDGPGAQAVKVTSASTVAAGTITADTVDFTAVTGAVTGVTLANTAGVAFTGGAGNTVVIGSGASDLITTGVGADTITPSGGADIITTGAGFDTVRLLASVATANVAPSVTDFTVGATTTSTDIIGISQGNTFAAGGAAGLATGDGAAGSLAAAAIGTLTVQNIATGAGGLGAATAGTGFFKLTSATAGVGGSAQAVFAAAMGNSVVTTLGADTQHLVVVYDATAGRALLLDVLTTETVNTELQAADAVRVIGSIVMSAADYAIFGANNIFTF